MSGFEALSMVCSIMQVISFTKEVLTLCKDVYDGHPTTDGRMEENTASIKVLLDEMNRCSGSIQQQTKDEKELYLIAQKCSKAAQELQKEIQQITKHHKPGDYIRAIISGYKSKSHKRKVTSLYDLFCQYQKTLETHILVRICTKTDATELQRRENFTNLSDTMKYFISQLAAGHTEMANLTTREGIQTRQQIQKSEARVKQSINDAHAMADYEVKKNRLLRSLKYESMNARRTELKPAHEATYVSIFESLEIDEKPTSSSAAAWRKFVRWLQSDERVFWIQGKPGAGKSTLLKFLLHHENTQKGVDKWSPNALIASHFFWKPGDVLQKNLRGLLCSLNHQLLSSEHNLVDHVLSESALTGQKDTIGDWEISELESMFHSILIQCQRSVLFLIDGLDEATETEEILQFLDSLIDLRNAKLCISSRGEDIFVRKFSAYDGFKLHELTKDDMLQLASTGIPVPDDIYPSDFLEDLINLLVDKAEGVYLWLVIALESVKRGFRNNDAQHEIHLRLSKLPSKLEELYADMWDRLGEDKEIYEKEAARYFSLLILSQSFVDKYSQSYHVFLDWRLSPFQLMLATNEKMKAKMLNKSYQLSVSEISHNCADTAKGISTRTAGLLVTKDTHGLVFDPPSGKFVKVKRTTDPSQFSQYLGNKVAFIHRTLLDFLKDNEVGRNILARNQTHCIDVDFAVIILCELRATQYYRGLSQEMAKEMAGLGPGTPLHYLLWILSQIFVQDYASESKTSIDLLHAFEGLFEAGLLPWDDRPEWYPFPCFDVLLISDPAFDWFIQSRVENRGVSHATCLLRDFTIARALHPIWHWNILDSEEYVLSLGGDINSVDICLYHSPMTIDGFVEAHSYATRPPEFATYESILSAVIRRLYNQIFAMSQGLPISSYEMWRESMQILVAVLERAPNLDKRTSFLLGMEHIRGANYKKIIDISDLLYTMTLIEKEDEKEILQLNPMDTEYYHAHIIAEVNMKHLIEHFFKAVPSHFIGTMPLITRAQELTEMDSSKPHAKARFYVQLSLPASMTCYRFVNQNFDILADSIIAEPTFDSFPLYSLTADRIVDHLHECERVDFSALSALADEKLGVCRLEDMGIKPPS